MGRTLDSLGTALAAVAIGAVALLATIAFVVVGPLLTEPGTHAAEDATFGLIAFAPLWIAGAWGIVLLLGLLGGWAGRVAGLVWVAWAVIAGFLGGVVTGMTDILARALSQGAAGVAGYNLDRPDLWISVVLWAGAVLMLLALTRTIRRTSYLR